MSFVDTNQETTDTEYRHGVTPYGERVHLVDFDTDSLLALGAGEPDKLLCGPVGDYEPVPKDEIDDALAEMGVCATCQRKWGRKR